MLCATGNTIARNKEDKNTVDTKRIDLEKNNINYVSMTDASKKLSIPLPTILWRLNSKNPKFNNYKYSESMQPLQP